VFATFVSPAALGPKRKSSKTRIETECAMHNSARVQIVQKGNPAKQGLKLFALFINDNNGLSKKEIQQNKD